MGYRRSRSRRAQGACMKKINALKRLCKTVRPAAYQKSSVEGDGSCLKVKLSTGNKFNVQTTTGYNPLRDRLINHATRPADRKQLDKILLQQKSALTQTPSPDKDGYLMLALSQIKNTTPAESSYLKNELGLQQMSLTQKDKAICSITRNQPLDWSSFYGRMNSLRGEKFKEVAAESERLDLSSMVHSVDGVSTVSMSQAFDGLRPEDYLIVREFDPMKRA